jgi:hypothetical protein
MEVLRERRITAVWSDGFDARMLQLGHTVAG